jgi:streptogramin lyase
VPITNDDKEKLPLMAVRGGSSPAEVKDARKRAIDASNTKYWPTFGGMLVDDAGRIWVEDWATGGGGDPTRPSYWTAFDSTGKLLGRLLIPAAASRESRQHVVGFGRDEVFIYHLDDDGAVHFTAYPIRPIGR